MATITIAPGQQVTQDPSAVRTYVMDWDALNLPSGVAAASSSWRVTPISPSFVDDAMVLDQESRLTAAQATIKLSRTVTGDYRATEVRVSLGTLHQIYEVVNQ